MTAERRWQNAWNYAQLGLLIFPLIPILGALGIFLGLIVTWKQKFRQIIRSPINQGLAILSIWLIITASFAHNRLEAFLGLGNFFPFFIFFAGFSTLIQTPSQLRRLSWIIVITSIPVVILGLGQLFLNWTTPIQLQGISGWVLELKGNPPGRMSSVFMYANILACYLTIVFILGLGLCFEEGRRKKEEGRRKKEEGKEKTDLSFLNSESNPVTNYQSTITNYQSPITNYQLPFLSIAVIGNALALILTNSRNAWGLAILASLAFALYLGWRTLVALVVSTTGGILWSAFGPEPVRKWLREIVPYFIWGRLTDQMYQNRPVATLRKTQWEFALNMTQQRPWTGWGLRNFTPLYEAQMHRWLGHPHNLFLMLTAETGIPSTIFLCGLVGWIFAQGILLLVKSPLAKNESYLSGDMQSHFPILAEQDRIIFFSYLTAFAACTLFNTVDVTLFDLRVNAIGWLLLAAICGQVNRGNSISGKLAK
ncbi:O-antigen ligase family protein [Kamptonema sp. UHCC 0994]|uniref:O-antigen ligase family protein n=1 Tax=Kamptonema sp. UHCC 0994 TaxID=3031329 RepID=UPI0023B918DC|nr:O-antigen ligase family protein [Kamptonema sp. UHCC 0994]MDF0554413.1 O-antigen ligase family protein [Kamptonema sp. UHCC 0994]